MATSAHSTIHKHKDELISGQMAKPTNKLNKSHNFIEEMENLFLMWFKQKEIATDSIGFSCFNFG